MGYRPDKAAEKYFDTMPISSILSITERMWPRVTVRGISGHFGIRWHLMKNLVFHIFDLAEMAVPRDLDEEIYGYKPLIKPACMYITN